jgi:hypothetical protein
MFPGSFGSLLAEEESSSGVEMKYPMRLALEAWRGDRVGNRRVGRNRNIAAAIAGNPFHNETILTVIAEWSDRASWCLYQSTWHSHLPSCQS